MSIPVVKTLTDKWIRTTEGIAERVLWPRTDTTEVSTHLVAECLWRLIGEVWRLRNQNRLLADELRRFLER